MINRTKLAAIVALAVTSFATAPALAQSFDADEGTGNVLPFYNQSAPAETTSHRVAAHAARRDGMDSYAMEPRARMENDPHNPEPIGGGTTGYN